VVSLISTQAFGTQVEHVHCCVVKPLSWFSVKTVPCNCTLPAATLPTIWAATGHHGVMEAGRGQMQGHKCGMVLWLQSSCLLFANGTWETMRDYEEHFKLAVSLPLAWPCEAAA
jgi:hypothetical protein